MPEKKTAAKAGKKFRFQLSGVDGNAFSIMGRWKREAKRHGWTDEQVAAVLEECRSGDYDHLLQTIMRCTDAR